MKCIFLSARSAAVLLDETAPYFLPAPVRLTLNGRDAGEADRTVYSLYGLSPDTAYTLTAQAEGGPVRNWFLEEDSFRREGYFSLEDTANDLLEDPAARKDDDTIGDAGIAGADKFQHQAADPFQTDLQFPLDFFF